MREGGDSQSPALCPDPMPEAMPAWYAATTAKPTVIVGMTVDFIPTATPVMMSVVPFECGNDKREFDQINASGVVQNDAWQQGYDNVQRIDVPIRELTRAMAPLRGLSDRTDGVEGVISVVLRALHEDPSSAHTDVATA